MIIISFNLDQKKFYIKKIFGKKNRVKKILGPKKFLGSNIFFGQKILGQKNFGSKKFWVKNFLGHKDFGSKNILCKKFMSKDLDPNFLCLKNDR